MEKRWTSYGLALFCVFSGGKIREGYGLGVLGYLVDVRSRRRPAMGGAEGRSHQRLSGVRQSSPPGARGPVVKKVDLGRTWGQVQPHGRSLGGLRGWLRAGNKEDRSM